MNELGSNNTYFFYSSYTKKLCIEQLEGSGLKKKNGVFVQNHFTLPYIHPFGTFKSDFI